MRALAIATVFFLACGPATATAPTGPVLANTGGTASPSPGPHVVMATLERTACFGWCPIYTVTIYRDGAVEYAGQDYVKLKGAATGHLSADKIAALDALFEQVHYFDLVDATNYEMTDMPSANTSYVRGGQHHAVKDYHGDSKAAPGLRQVEEAVDAAVDIEQWIGTDKEREKMMQTGP